MAQKGLLFPAGLAGVPTKGFLAAETLTAEQEQQHPRPGQDTSSETAHRWCFRICSKIRKLIRRVHLFYSFPSIRNYIRD